MSKGSARRPAAVPPEVVEANYQRTFTKHPALGAAFGKPEPVPTFHTPHVMLRNEYGDITFEPVRLTPSPARDDEPSR
jgi:hypothetical protein